MFLCVFDSLADAAGYKVSAIRLTSPGYLDNFLCGLHSSTHKRTRLVAARVLRPLRDERLGTAIKIDSRIFQEFVRSGRLLCSSSLRLNCRERAPR